MSSNLSTLKIIQFLLFILLIVAISTTFYYSMEESYIYLGMDSQNIQKYFDISDQNTATIFSFGAISVACIISIVWLEIHKGNLKKNM